MKIVLKKIKSIISFIVSIFIMCCGTEIRVPVNYTALTGDLEIHVQNVIPQDDLYYLQLLEYYPIDNSFTIMGSTPLHLDNTSIAMVYKAKFPCGLISQGGSYGVRIQPDYDNDVNEILITMPEDIIQNASIIEETNKKLRVTKLDVRWPSVSMSIEPREIETYPELTVTASVMFQASYCDPSVGSLVPETWISLVYCGHSSIECKLDNISHISQILYSEQIRGYPTLREIHLECQLFGQAGYYTFILTSEMHGTGAIIASMPSSAILKVKWSESFVFNVHTRSIFQCDAHGGGVAVLFQYPECILLNDKIRLFGSLRADVASLLPITSLHYIAEQKVIKGKYSLHFDCDLFSEKYVEYCFVYVNQAITGAVSDVRMDCVPTFPVSDKDAGQWSSWSEWSECSTTCKGGTKNRYRFCDSPLPKYGAKYCEGHTVETQECGNSTSWDCQLYNSQLMPELLAEKPEIQEVIGEKCKCGCIIHLDKMIPQRFLAASMRNCSQSTLWKIQADSDHTIQLYMNRVHFPCNTQKLKIHDGAYLSSNLLAQFTSTDAVTFKNFSVMSSGSVLLLKYSISENMNNNECLGGFLCHFQQKGVLTTYISNARAESMSGDTPVKAVHVAILVMLVVVVSMSLCMIVQYVNRYHKYQKTSVNEDTIDTEDFETDSKQNLTSVISHETSTSTLISEIIPLQNVCKEKKRLKQDYPKVNYDCLSHSGSDENDEQITKDPVESNQVEKCGEQNLNIHTFQAEVHVENQPNESSGSYKTQSSITDDTASDTNNSFSSHKVRVSDRRPSLCTRPSISPSFSTHTNVMSSPNSSLKGSTLKRVKDIRNQEKVNVGSDFSLAGQDTDLEIDYYDYNVHNTNTVPGSYLGMDPAYCVWIPPFAPGQWIDNGNDGDSSSNDEIEMKTMSSYHDSESRSETPISEKFQKECKNSSRNKENFKRYSNVSTTSSGNRTVVPEDITPDDSLAIQEALSPDTPIEIQKAVVIKDVDQAVNISTLLKDDDLKFADEDDSDTAYNSEDNDITQKSKKLSVKKAKKKTSVVK